MINAELIEMTDATAEQAGLHAHDGWALTSPQMRSRRLVGPRLKRPQGRAANPPGRSITRHSVYLLGGRNRARAQSPNGLRCGGVAHL